MLKLSVGDLQSREEVELPRPRRPAWYKATDDNKSEFTSQLDDKVRHIQRERPDSLNCQDVHCQDNKCRDDRDSYLLDLLSAAIETSHVTIPTNTGGKKNISNPGNGCYSDKCLPGWREEVQPFREDAQFWFSVWQSAGSPSHGVLRDIMARTKNKFHYAVRRCKKMANEIRANRLLDAATDGGVDDLMKEMKKVKGGKKGGQSIPECVEGAQGTEEILEKFREVYEALYNSAGSVEAMAVIKESLSTLIDDNSINEVQKITGEVVKEACCRMKANKSDVSGSYTSDIHLNAPDSLFEELSSIFRSFLIHGDVAIQLLSCAFLPLFKGGLKNPTSTDSYRAIAGSSQILKLFDYVILHIWGDLLESDSIQFGFKKKVSTTQCSWLVL